MDKCAMREWVSSIETVVDNKLGKWKKSNPVEDKQTVTLGWQFEHTNMLLNIAWEADKEIVSLHCIGPTACHRYFFYGLNDQTFNGICDRVGNLAQVIMHPPIDPHGIDG